MATAMVTPTYHPKTGERRRVRRSLRLDHLPLALLDRVRAERAKGHTWSEIENDSPNWQEWEDASLEVLASFPGRRLPHSNLQRWHDLRVEQVQREQEGQTRTAQAFADRLAEHGVTHLNAAVKNALCDFVFRMMLENADPRLIRAELFRLAQLLSTLQRDEIAQGRLELDREKLKLAARKEETARCLTLSRLHGSERTAFDVDWRASPVSREERAASAAGAAGTSSTPSSPTPTVSHVGKRTSACPAEDPLRPGSGQAPRKNLESDKNPQNESASAAQKAGEGRRIGIHLVSSRAIPPQRTSNAEPPAVSVRPTWEQKIVAAIGAEEWGKLRAAAMGSSDTEPEETEPEEKEEISSPLV